MLVSRKQHTANRQNAQRSTGPKTPEGKAAVRFNALTYGLRTRATVLESENAADYSRLWDELDADWQPQNRTERCHLETMVTSQWLLVRLAASERRIYESIPFGEERFKMLAYVARQRAQLERSFRTAIADLRQLQKERPSRPQPQPAQATVPPPAKPVVPRPNYLMSEDVEAQPVFCDPATPDTR